VYWAKCDTVHDYGRTVFFEYLLILAVTGLATCIVLLLELPPRPTWWGGARCSLPKHPPRCGRFGHQSSPLLFMRVYAHEPNYICCVTAFVSLRCAALSKRWSSRKHHYINSLHQHGANQCEVPSRRGSRGNGRRQRGQDRQTGRKASEEHPDMSARTNKTSLYSRERISSERTRRRINVVVYISRCLCPYYLFLLLSVSLSICLSVSVSLSLSVLVLTCV